MDETKAIVELAEYFIENLKDMSDEELGNYINIVVEENFERVMDKVDDRLKEFGVPYYPPKPNYPRKYPAFIPAMLWYISLRLEKEKRTASKLEETVK